ncbi:MAG: hypothetical protein MK135_08290 [Polyangiaceae bacterium]|nr:hypothetical protein [Polyangiaceae bacterium]
MSSTQAPLPRKVLSAGSEIDAWCTRCKLDLGHRIVAMVGTSPKRVVCMTCDSEHNYRVPKSEAGAKSQRRVAKKTTSATKAKGTSRAAASRADWEEKVRSGSPIQRYMVTSVFKENDLVQHKKFGDGYVVALLEGNKLSIRFADGEKTLIHGLEN